MKKLLQLSMLLSTLLLMSVAWPQERRSSVQSVAGALRGALAEVAAFGSFAGAVPGPRK